MPSSEPSQVGPARILTVCTGNICRSPYAERVLWHAFPADLVVVTSAGTSAMVADGIDVEAVALLQARQMHHAGHSARQLTRQIIEDADLVLAMTTEHRTAVVRLLPRAVRKTFTAREVGRLIPAADLTELPSGAADRVRALPARLAAARGQLARGTASDDVGDPYRRGAEAFRLMAEELDPALESLVDAVTGRKT